MLIDIVFKSASLMVLLCIIIFSAVATAALFSRYYFRNLIHEKQLRMISAEQDNKVLRAQVEIQEETFQQLSRDIHDDIGQKLTLLRLYLAQSKADDLREGPEIVSEVIQQLRDLSQNLSADVVRRDGLYEAVRQDTERVNARSGVKVTLVRSERFDYLPDDKELILFRIYQEAVQNALKHAKAKQVTVKLDYTAGDCILRVYDDGIGFTTTGGRGQGLKNMALRTKSIGGKSNIRSGTEGTFLTFTIPTGDHAKN